MLCIPVKGPSIADAVLQIKEALSWTSFIELRLDAFESYTLDELQRVQRQFADVKFIFTVRSVAQGGSYRGREEKRVEHLRELAALLPAYLDIEWDVSLDFVQSLKRDYPSLKLIVSFHDFEKTPSPAALLACLRSFPADLYKIATYGHDVSDLLESLEVMRQGAPQALLMNMGEVGTLSRILAPLVGAPFVYASLNEKQATAPGQMMAKELMTIYRHSQLNEKTHLYGLIGYPIDGSPSHLSHNALFAHFHLNALYVKFPVQTSEFPSFIQRIQKLPIRGLSVTMPLKEEIIPYLTAIDSAAQDIGAVNTVVFKSGDMIGYNTDGQGALDALETHQKVRGKRVVILGAGGAARAIVYEAKQRGADVIVLNRHPAKAHHLAHLFDCQGNGLEEISQVYQAGYDMIINTTPHPLPIDPQWILEGATVMDIVIKPKMTPFLEEGKKKRCFLVYGYEMFINQALAQFALWLDGILPSPMSRSILEVQVFDYLEQ